MGETSKYIENKEQRRDEMLTKVIASPTHVSHEQHNV
jgi:hypothetical protein